MYPTLFAYILVNVRTTTCIQIYELLILPLTLCWTFSNGSDVRKHVGDIVKVAG